MAKEKKEEAIARIMKGLSCSKEEAEDVYNYDQVVEHEKNAEFDLSPERQKIAQSYTRTGTRKSPVYQFATKERKPNATKEEIISELFAFLENQNNLSITNLQVANKERQIIFEMNEEKFELTLVQKRKTK